VIRRRRKHPNGISTKPITRRTRSPRNQARVKRKKQNSPPNYIESIISWLKNADLGNLSGQLNTIADHIEPEKVSNLIKKFNDLNGTDILKDGSKLNLMNILKDKDTVNHLLAVLLEVFGANNLTKEEKEEVK